MLHHIRKLIRNNDLMNNTIEIILRWIVVLQIWSNTIHLYINEGQREI